MALNLHQPQECWDYRCVSSHLASNNFITKTLTISCTGPKREQQTICEVSIIAIWRRLLYIKTVTLKNTEEELTLCYLKKKKKPWESHQAFCYSILTETPLFQGLPDTLLDQLTVPSTFSCQTGNTRTKPPTFSISHLSAVQLGFFMLPFCNFHCNGPANGPKLSVQRTDSCFSGVSVTNENILFLDKHHL